MSVIKSLMFQNVSFQHDEHHRVLENCSFAFPLESVVRIHGPHGCGKSTLLKLLACLLEPQGGEIVVDGQVVNEMSFEELIPLRLKIGYAFDYGGLLNNMTIRQNLLLPVLYHKIMPADEAEAHVDSLIEMFSLQRSAQYRPSAISGGQRKLACVARSFVLNPEMVILDDPTQGLSDKATEKLIQVIGQRMAEKTLRHIFLTTENPLIIGELVNRDIVFQDQVLFDFEDYYNSTVKGESAA